MRAEPERRTVAYVACLALAVVRCACACGSAPADHADGAGQRECPEGIYCLLGLKQVYGLWFRVFIPLDAGGPLTLQALEAGSWLRTQGLPSMGKALR